MLPHTVRTSADTGTMGVVYQDLVRLRCLCVAASGRPGLRSKLAEVALLVAVTQAHAARVDELERRLARYDALEERLAALERYDALEQRLAALERGG